MTLLGMPMIDQFHKDPDIFIFLISTLAGGTGLNLTGEFLATVAWKIANFLSRRKQGCHLWCVNIICAMKLQPSMVQIPIGVRTTYFV